ncbi:sugar phosphate nucleotidyltransferase [Desulfatitalea tepidiphila]|uniref:sugar phosphate nucleotidyltransferase n=1 Tax=Desulfatitalea tepidiphila TaxID=1185843 RepID=UPI0006B667A7|nr:sugar phosphate nucleotidyltransferase [Desulfatitalea tepidiphila]
MRDDVCIIILAAGLGTRMKSEKAKVLHEICGKPMIEYVVRTAAVIAGQDIIIVVGHQAEKVKITVNRIGTVSYALQKEQHGTGHAVQCAQPLIPEKAKDVVILCGDVPLIRPNTILNLIDVHQEGDYDVSLLAVTVDDPKGYGRIILDDRGRLSAIVEEADADASQKKINLINTGIYAVRSDYLREVLPRLGANNAQKEIYLTDIIGIGYADGKSIGFTIGDDSTEIIGVNSVKELELAETFMKNRKIQRA